MRTVILVWIALGLARWVWRYCTEREDGERAECPGSREGAGDAEPSWRLGKSLGSLIGGFLRGFRSGVCRELDAKGDSEREGE